MRRLAVLGTVLAVALGVTACGGGGSSSTSTGNDPGEGGVANGGTVDTAAAKAAIAPYLGHPSPAFPVDEPLKSAPRPGTKFAQLQFGTPTGGLIAEIADGAAAAAGVDMSTVKAGTTASSVQAAASSILSQSPEGVLLPAAEPGTFATQLAEMAAQKIKVVSGGIMDPAKYRITAAIFDQRQAKLAGKLLADWVISTKGEEADVVFYEVPELSLSSFEAAGFDAELSKDCPSCAVRQSVVSATEIGTKAPQTIVSDLQSHPDTNTAVFAATEAATGLPAALKAAGIEISIAGLGADPTSLQYVKEGAFAAMLALDVPVQVWTQMDMALRLVEGQPLTAGEKAGVAPMQLLEPKDITFDPAKGWTGTPDFAERFAKYWNP